MVFLFQLSGAALLQPRSIQVLLSVVFVLIRFGILILLAMPTLLVPAAPRFQPKARRCHPVLFRFHL